MAMPDRWVHLTFQIDTNRINSRASLPNMNRLQKWANDDVITIEISEIAQQEATKGKDAARTRKANSYIFSMTMAGTPQEREMLGKIEHILFPVGAQTENQRNDVLIVFNAWKYQCILVTNDGGSKRQPGGILGNIAKFDKLGVHVMSDEEAVRLVEEKIRRRDRLAVESARRTGEQLPWWVGTD